MDAITTEWGATRSRALPSLNVRDARRLARAIAAIERWADRAAESLTARSRASDWTDSAQSGLADVASRVAELGRCLRVGLEPRAIDVALDDERAWCAAALTEALAAEGSHGIERLNALGRAAAIAEAGEQLARLARAPRRARR